MAPDLAYIREASNHLLTHGFAPDAVNAALALIGRGAGVDRVYVFENFLGADGALLCRQRFEWCADGVEPQIENPILQAIAYDEVLPDWSDRLSRDLLIQGPTAELDARLRAILEPQGVVSILICPIVHQGPWWGFVGFDDCRTPRRWPIEEVEALRRLARALAGALHSRTMRVRSDIVRQQLVELLARERP